MQSYAEERGELEQRLTELEQQVRGKAVSNLPRVNCNAVHIN